MNWQEFWNNKGKDLHAGVQVGRVSRGKAMDEIMMRRIAEKIAQQLDLNEKDSLLDVCCGNGYLDTLLLPYCKEITGIDFSESLMASAKELKIDALKFICADAQFFELPHAYDKVMLYFSFQYFEDKTQAKEVVYNLCKHLKPGGKILIGDIPDKRRFFQYYHNFRKCYQYIKQSVLGKNDMGRFWHPDELIELVRQENYTYTIVEQESWQPYANYRFDLLIESKSH